MDAATVHNIVAPAQGHGTPYTYLAWRSGAALRTMGNHKGCPYTPQSISAIQRINQRIRRTPARARHAVHLPGMAERGRAPHHGQPQGLPLHPSKYLRHPTHQPENPAHAHRVRRSVPPPCVTVWGLVSALYMAHSKSHRSKLMQHFWRRCHHRIRREGEGAAGGAPVGGFLKFGQENQHLL